MADEQIRIDIVAEDDASKVIDDVAEDAENLEKLTPEVTVTADTDQAERGIKDVSEDADALARKDAEILLRAKIDDAKAALKSIRDDLDQTGDRARDTAQDLDKIGGGGDLKTRGNAIADLTGPLGDASGAASDFAGVFDGIGDIAEDVAGKVGLNAAVMSTAIGGIGIAVAAGAAAWTLFRQNQEKAKARQKELVEGQREINDALKDADIEAAARKFEELYKGPLNAAESLGVTTRQMTEYITGQSDAVQTNLDLWKETGGLQKEAAEAIEGNRQAYQDTNGTIAEQDQRLRDVAGAMSAMATDTDKAVTAQEKLERQADRTRNSLDRIEGALDMQQAFLNFQTGMQGALDRVNSGAGNTEQEVLDIKQSILDVAEAAKLTPIEVQTLLEKVSNGDLAGVKSDVEGYYARNAASIDTKLRPPTQAEYAAMNDQIRRGIGIIQFAAVLGQVRSGAYG